MRNRFFIFFLFLSAFFSTLCRAELSESQASGASSLAAGTTVKEKVVVVPVHGEINKANWYIFRRAVKAALEDSAGTLVLDVNTPGGELGITFDYIEVIQNFPGEVLAFVNPDAISAGAYISASAKKIYFSPKGKIGAAAVVSSAGTEIDSTMKMKINSYLGALTKTFSKGDPYRALILRAMFDADYVLEIDGKVLKDKGELLTLTADEAMRKVGENQQPLLGVGICENIDSLLATHFAGKAFSVNRIEPVGLEKFAQIAQPFLPILLGLGMLLIFLEIKTPGFGVPGISGAILVVLYFALQHVAGLAGYEGVLLFFLGVGLLVLEVFVFTGSFICGIAGILCIVGAVFWSGIEFLPLPNSHFEFRWAMLTRPLQEFGLAILTSFVAAFLAWKFLPKKYFRNKIVLSSQVGDIEDNRLQGARLPACPLPEIGAVGKAITNCVPVGIVEIDGKQFDAQVETGTIARGDPVCVVAYRDFELVVRKKAC